VNRLFGKLATKIGISWLLCQVRAAAEGRLGLVWQERYVWLSGKKTYTGLVAAVASAILLALGYNDAAGAVAIAATIAVQAGVLDKAWRNELPDWLASSRIYRGLAANSVLLATLLAGLYASTTKCGADCSPWPTVILALGAAMVQLGLLDTAWRSTPPDTWPTTDPVDLKERS
jgi:hypothetical protein